MASSSHQRLPTPANTDARATQAMLTAELLAEMQLQDEEDARFEKDDPVAFRLAMEAEQDAFLRDLRLEVN
jgi:hypothetical protein